MTKTKTLAQIEADKAAKTPKMFDADEIVKLNPEMRAELKKFFQRVQSLENDRQTITRDISEVYAEAKAANFDVEAMKTAIKLARLDEDDREHRRELADLYLDALTEPTKNAA